jgi:hypothetical protein
MTNDQALAILIYAAANGDWAAKNWRTVAVARNIVEAIIATAPRYEKADVDER